ncbi:hypothetical protein BGZ72_002985 [Mortierella alpina]|nr:hypothetical protein BGZ72_002985 [Mortierella alpina]
MLARTGLKYPSKLHCEKVASFLPHSARHEAIILAKGTQVQNRDNTDVELEFRQESNFYYLTGVLEADFYFIYDLSRGHSFLIAPDLDPVKAVWKGPGLSDKQLLEKYNVDHVVRYSKLLDLLKHQLKPKHIHGWNSPEDVSPLADKDLEHELEQYISHRLVHPKKDELQEPKPRPARPHDHGPYGDHHGHRCFPGFPGFPGHHDHKHRHDPDHDHPGHGKPKKEPVDTTLLEAMIFARINKSPIEIALSRESTRISSDAHRLIMKTARAGMYEYQLEALFRYECARQGGKTQAYLPIVGTGVNGAYLHYTRNDTRLKDGQLLLIDAACEADCYGSDITRTIPVNGQFTADQLEIYNLVLEMQTSVIRSMAKGVDWTQMNILSQKIGIRGLKRLGILKGEEVDLFESGVIKIFYPHGLGHLLGLNVHDDGLGLGIQIPSKPKALASQIQSKTGPVQFHSADADNRLSGATLPPPSSRRNKALGSSLYATPATVLEPGMLLTVEPGIYFNPAQIEFALDTFYLAPYLDEPTIRRFMTVGGVRLEDVVLILPDGSVDNITTAPKDPREVEYIMQEGQREYQQSLKQDLGATISEKPTKHKEEPLAPEPPRGIKKRVGVFKKLMRAIRNMF